MVSTRRHENEKHAPATGAELEFEQPHLHRSDIKQFVADRDHAFLSMDEATIRAYCRKWHIHIPDNPTVFWAGIHKARTAATSLPREVRLLSKMWLTARGFQSFDGGELDLMVA